MTQFADEVWDFIIIGSGFGGSVSALRLAEKGYRTVVLERGKRFEDEDFATTNWQVWKSLWAPRLRCYGVLDMTLLPGALILHGAGVGGGSLGYANVLMRPDEAYFKAPGWRDLADWKSILAPHYQSARDMLGVTTNPHAWPADQVIQKIADRMGRQATYRPAEVGVYFGEPGVEVPDPYFGGLGPRRSGCVECGGCMVGCRYNAKNTLPKNYLYFAEKSGAKILPEVEALEIQALQGEGDGARYAVVCRRTTAWGPARHFVLRAASVVVAAGVLGTLKLLLRSRDRAGGLPRLSSRLGEEVRTNSEALMGVSARASRVDYSKGLAITSSFKPDSITEVQPVRYPAGSSFMRLLASPILRSGRSTLYRLFETLWETVKSPIDSLKVKVLPGWSERTTILLIMQTADSRMRLGLGSGLAALGSGLSVEHDVERRIKPRLEVGEYVAHAFAKEVGGIAQTSFFESLLNVPVTAHILGGCPMGVDLNTGVVDVNCEAFGYPGLYVVDGSIVPANPGLNPSLTIAAMAEYAMSRIPPKPAA